MKIRFNEKSPKPLQTNVDIYVKRVPNLNQVRYQNSSTINAKTGNETNHEQHQKHVFLICKNMEISYNENWFWKVFAGCVRKRKKVSKTIKHETKLNSIVKLIENESKINARNIDAKT